MCAKGVRYRPRYSRVGARSRAIAVDDAAILLEAGSIAARERARPAVIGEGSHEQLPSPPFLLSFCPFLWPPPPRYLVPSKLPLQRRRVNELSPRVHAVKLGAPPGPIREPSTGTPVRRRQNKTTPTTRLPDPAGHHQATKNQGCCSWLYAVPLALERRLPGRCTMYMHIRAHFAILFRLFSR